MKMWVPTRFQIWFSSKVIYCGAMCTTNITCQAFYFDSTKCYEAEALNLIGALSDSQTKKKVYMDKSLTRGSIRETCSFIFFYFDIPPKWAKLRLQTLRQGTQYFMNSRTPALGISLSLGSWGSASGIPDPDDVDTTMDSAGTSTSSSLVCFMYSFSLKGAHEYAQ